MRPGHTDRHISATVKEHIEDTHTENQSSTVAEHRTGTKHHT
jgi:hypothetical protein